MIKPKIPLPEPFGMKKELFLDGKNRPVEVYPMQEGNKEVYYALIQKPHTDFGITASVRRIK